MTCYDGDLHFGLVATRDMKELHKLAEYPEEELGKLEGSVIGL